MGCGPSRSSSTEMLKSEKTIKAALLIQNWFRRYKARLEARRRSSWRIFQSIEYAGEQDQLKLYNFFNDMLSHLDTEKDHGTDIEPGRIGDIHNHSPVSTPSSQAEEDDFLTSTDFSSIRVPSSYKGVHLQFPVTSKTIQCMVEAFKSKKTLHARYLLELLHESRKCLKNLGNINHVSLSLSKKITVCGDLHGKIDDLFTIFYKNGLPGMDNPYIFNGDFVDRGPHSVEIAALLFACFLAYPHHVFINRGNHEDHIMNIRYGFVKEIMTKYKSNATKVIRMFEELFSWLPLATVIEKKILVVHGGISDKTDLEALAALNRHKYVSALKPPFRWAGGDDTSRSSDTTTSSTEKSELLEWRQILDVLWSDPKNQLGCTANTFRGGGCYFGADITDKILRKHKLKLLIRSHECKPDGYEYTHYKQVLTIFSASNYYEEGSNKGAYITMGQDLQPHFVQFSSSKLQKGRKYTIRQRVGIIETSALRDLKEKIYASQSDLIEEFKKYDENGTGQISILTWCACMENVLHLDLPWRTLAPNLNIIFVKDSLMVEYYSTFDQYELKCKFEAESGPSITETLYRNRDSLGTIFRIIDKDNSGLISMEEFEDACDILSRHIGQEISKQQVRDLGQSIDINKDGSIDFNEFLEAFRLVDQNPRGKSDVELVSLKTSSSEPTNPGDLSSMSSGSTVTVNVVL